MKNPSDPQFTPEQELLLWSIRVDHAKDQRVAEILTEGIDWTHIRETAVQHGIIPLLYKRLKEDMKDLVPAEELSELRALFMANAVHNIRMTKKLLKVLDLLNEAGVECMPFKGPALAIQAYGDISMRSFCDLDILINANDLSLAYQVLVNRGCIPRDFIDSRIGKKLRLIQKKDLPFSCQNDFLEIHWKITERFLAAQFDMDKVWVRSLPVFLNNQKFKTLSPEDMVIVLCLHGNKHSWQELKWLADLVYMISNHPEIRWRELFDYAQKTGLQRIVLLGLSLAQEHGGINSITDPEYQFRRETTIQNLKFIIQTNFFHRRIGDSFFAHQLFYLKSRERSGDKVKFLIYSFTDRLITPNSKDFDVITLPKHLLPLYLIIRQVRLIKVYWLRKITSVKTNNK